MPNTQHAFEATIASNTELPLLSITTLPVLWINLVSLNNKLPVGPSSEKAGLGFSGGLSFPSTSSIANTMSHKQQQILWYLLPNRCGFRSTHVQPGCACLASQTDMDSSRQVAQSGTNFSDILLFHASINCCIKWNQSW